MRILENEWLGTRLPARSGLPCAAVSVVEVRGDLIAHTEDLVIPLGGRVSSKAGLQFGSRYPGQPAETAVYDFLPKEQLRRVTYLKDSCGLLVFDKWTYNRNGREAIFFRAKGESHY